MLHPTHVLEPPANPARFSQVGFARVRDVEARIGQGVEHARAVGDQADANLIQNPRVQLVATLRAGRGLYRVADLLGAFQLHRIGPAVALVHDIAQTVERVLVAGRRDVQAAPRGQFQARCAEVELDAGFVGMSDPEHLILLRVQPLEGQLFEPVHNLGLLFLGWGIGGGKADHACAIGPLVAAGVN